MSDALTDLARDSTRSAFYGDFLQGLFRYLKDPSQDNHNLVKTLAGKTDDVPQGYWGGRTSLTEKLPEKLEKLRQGNKREWARLLWGIEEYTNLYKSLMDISPFKGKVLLKVDYGIGFVNVKREGIDRLIEGADFKTEDCDDYVVAIPEEMMKDLDITWVRCGISGVNGPRDSRGKPKK